MAKKKDSINHRVGIHNSTPNYCAGFTEYDSTAITNNCDCSAVFMC